MSEKTGIITRIKPLFDELLKQGFITYVEKPEFVRACNRLEISVEYTIAYNKAVKVNSTDFFNFSPHGLDYHDFLPDFLNQIHTNRTDSFTNIIAALLIDDLSCARRMIDLIDIIKDLEYLGIGKKKLEELLKAYEIYDQNLLLKAELLLGIILNKAEQGGGDPENYQKLRQRLIITHSLKEHIPKFLFDHSRLESIRPFAQEMGGYKARREFFHSEFAPLINYISENKDSSTIARSIVIDNEYIHLTWQKALSRMDNDPQGSITIARTLIETVCKHILDTSNLKYNDADDLPILYRAVANSLNLAPDQHTQEVFKQILGGCFSVVQGLGTIRNKISDAHGISEKRTKPSRRHAQLAVNLSGSLCQFLLESFLEKL